MSQVKIVVRGRGARAVSYNLITANNNHNVSQRQDWTIVKRFRVNPITLADTPYNPDFYRSMIRAGSVEGVKIQNWVSGDGEKIRAIQTMLHLQTNYNALLMAGFYRQPRAVIERSLGQWYLDIARQFPQYARYCELEFQRHLNRYDQGQGHDFRFVA